jgi:magnesium transporter
MSRLTALAFYPEKGVHEHIVPEAISDLLEEKDSLLWFDITAPKPDDMRLLQDELGLHPLALEEAITPHPRPKAAEFPGFYLMVMYAVDRLPEEPVHLREVVIYIGSRFLVTAHREAFPEIDECVRRWQANTALRRESIAAPVYSLLDTLVDGYFPVIDAIAEQVDALEDRLFAGEGDATQSSGLFTQKKDLLALRRVVAGERDALNLLLRQDVPLFAESILLYFQSVYDNLVRLTESIDTYRDLLSSAMDMHLTVLSNRMNRVMKTLTIVSTMLMSASLIAGVYGMNFAHMPELHWRYGYFGALGAMALVTGGLALFFRRIKWF